MSIRPHRWTELERKCAPFGKHGGHSLAKFFLSKFFICFSLEKKEEKIPGYTRDVPNGLHRTHGPQF